MSIFLFTAVSIVLVVGVSAVAVVLAMKFSKTASGSARNLTAAVDSHPQPITSAYQKVLAVTASGQSAGLADSGTVKNSTVSASAFPIIAKLTQGTDDTPVILASVKDYGAAGDGKTDDSDAIQNAINDVYAKYHGGTVLIPAGRYVVSKQINIYSDIRLRGDWTSPDSGGMGKGTIIYAYYGKNNPDGKPMFSVSEGATVSDMTIYYPEQKIEQVTPYAPTVGNGAYLTSNYYDLTLVNSYIGVVVAGHSSFNVRNVYGTVLSKGCYVNNILDIPRLENIHFSSKYWAMFENGMNAQKISAYTRTNLTGFDFGRVDWVYFDSNSIEGAKTGVYFENTSQGSCSGQLSNSSITDSVTGIGASALQAVGIQVANCTISTTGSNSMCVRGYEKFDDTQSMMFTNCTFSSEGKIAQNTASGVLTFTNCTFKGWQAGQYAITANGGGLLVDGCNFQTAGKSISLCNVGDLTVDAAEILGNVFKGSPVIENLINSTLSIVDHKASTGVIDHMSVQKVSIPKMRRAAKQAIFNARDYGLVDDSSADNSVAIQRALNAAGKNGGGIVYVEGGRFTVNNYLVVPSGVELRGVSDTTKHYGVGDKGTVLVTTYGKGASSANAFISLSANAGVNGISVFYPDQNYLNHVAYAPTFQGLGNGCWLYCINSPDAYNEVVMRCSDFQINDMRGLGLSTCLKITGANSGFVGNLMCTGGDWQDGSTEKNAPPSNWWKNMPNYHNTAIQIDNSKNVTFYEPFVFGMGTGIELTGNVSNLLCFAGGVDASENAVVLKNSGINNVFVNSELVAVNNYVESDTGYTGTASFYNTNCWISQGGNATFDGSGMVNLQVYKQSTGLVFINGSTVKFQDAYLSSTNAGIRVGKNAKGGSFVNSFVGSVSPDYENNAGSRFVIQNLLSK